MDIKKILLPFIAAGTIVTAGTVSQVTDRQMEFSYSYEGLALVPYKDIADPSLLTVCHGLTNRSSPGFVIEGKTYTKEECYNEEIKVFKDVNERISKLIKVDMTQEQREMLADFSYNLGIGAFSKSTLLKKINMNLCKEASLEFDKWAKSGGVIYKGLLRRRNDEEANFVTWCLPDGTFPKESK